MSKREPTKLTPTEAQLRGPGWNGESLRQLRKDNGITQQELADRAGLERSYVANIETGNTKFTETAGEALWSALMEIHTEKLERRAKEYTASGDPLARFYEAQSAMLEMVCPPPAKTIAQQKEYIALLEKQVETQRGVIETLNASTGFNEAARLLAEMEKLPHWEQIKYLITRIDAMEQKYADLCRLNGLRTEALIKTAEADDLAEQLQERLRKDGEQ